MEPHMEEDFFKEVLQKSAGPIPFLDFEDEIMMQIDARELRRESIWTNLKLSWFFFALGMITGILLMIILPEWQNNTGGIDAGYLAWSFLIIGCILVFILFARNLLTLTKKYRR